LTILVLKHIETNGDLGYFISGHLSDVLVPRQQDTFLERMTSLEPANCVTHWAQADGFRKRQLPSGVLKHGWGNPL